jgi:phage N-6-adenine-methyltransferase
MGYISNESKNETETEDLEPHFAGRQVFPDNKGSKPDFWTPKAVFEWAEKNLLPTGQTFDLDAAASSENHLVDYYYTEEDDALSLPWVKETVHGRRFGINVWCNPPYTRGLLSNLPTEKNGYRMGFIQKAIHEVMIGNVDRVVLLVPARPDVKWWRTLVDFGVTIHFITGRLNFGGPNAMKAAHGAPFPSALITISRDEYHPRGLTGCVWIDRPEVIE